MPVNDNPIIDLSSYTKFSSWGYKEGARSDSIPLTRYVYDEDNDTTDLIYTFKIIGSSQENPGYPTAKLGLNASIPPILFGAIRTVSYTHLTLPTKRIV